MLGARAIKELDALARVSFGAPNFADRASRPEPTAVSAPTHLGDETEIDVRTEQPEFCAWTWASPATVARMIVPFKRALYARVFGEFAPFLTDPPGA